MSTIVTGEYGTSLKDIIKELGNKSYGCIEFRVRWTDLNNDEHDEYSGACSYDAKNEKLTPLDNDSYSLDDLYVKWEEREEPGKVCLTVWEHGRLDY